MEVEGAATTLYLHQERGKPAGIRMFSPDCRLAIRGISGEITDMGTFSVDDSVALLLRIARDENFDMDLRQQALFGLAQYGLGHGVRLSRPGAVRRRCRRHDMHR